MYLLKISLDIKALIVILLILSYTMISCWRCLLYRKYGQIWICRALLQCLMRVGYSPLYKFNLVCTTKLTICLLVKRNTDDLGGFLSCQYEVASISSLLLSTFLGLRAPVHGLTNHTHCCYIISLHYTLLRGCMGVCSLCTIHGKIFKGENHHGGKEYSLFAGKLLLILSLQTQVQVVNVKTLGKLLQLTKSLCEIR